MPEQPLIDAARRLGIPIVGDQLDLEFCPTCDQPLPGRPLHCAHCGKRITEDEVSYWLDRGKFCLEPACQREARRWPVTQR